MPMSCSRRASLKKWHLSRDKKKKKWGLVRISYPDIWRLSVADRWISKCKYSGKGKGPTKPVVRKPAGSLCGSKGMKVGEKGKESAWELIGLKIQ